MDEGKPVAAVIEPFGVFGGRYQVDAAGLKLYRISWAIALTAIAVSIVGLFFDMPNPVRYAIFAAALIVALWLSWRVAKRGTKLPPNYPPDRPTSSP